MLYRLLANLYSEIEKTSSRLQMASLLAEFFSKTPPEIIDKVVYLTTGRLAPDFKGIELGLGESLVIKVIATVSGKKDGTIRELLTKTGDLGDVAAGIKASQKSLFTQELTVERVHETFMAIATSAGEKSQDRKMKLLIEILNDATSIEAKYIVRTVLGKLRLGVADGTLIDALVEAYGTSSGTPAQTKLPIVGMQEESSKSSCSTGVGEKNKDNIEDVEDAEDIEKTESETTVKKDTVVLGRGGITESMAKGENAEADLKGRKKSARAAIEHAYTLCADLGRVAKILAEEGLAGLVSVSMSVGVPLKPMLAERAVSMREILDRMGGVCALDYKYDGLRIQAHFSRLEGKSVTILYSRSNEDLTSQFPDVVGYIEKNIPSYVQGIILDGECVPYDIKTGSFMPFQNISHRRGRKYEMDEAQKDFPVVYIVFDILYIRGRGDAIIPAASESLSRMAAMVSHDIAPYLTASSLSASLLPRPESFTSGLSLVDFPFPVRRALLEAVFKDIKAGSGISTSTFAICASDSAGEEFFLSALDAGCEGLIANNIAGYSSYKAGARGWQWIKYKRDYQSDLKDSFDLVVIGAFSGKGKRTGFYGALLMAVFNPETQKYESICKLGSGFTEADLSKIKDMLEPFRMQTKPPDVASTIEPDVWFSPEIVLEVTAAEITLSPVHQAAWGKVRKDTGLAVRFPRYTGKIRTDKKAADATTTAEVLEMFKGQTLRASSVPATQAAAPPPAAPATNAGTEPPSNKGTSDNIK